MAQLVLMPQIGISDESAVLAAWHVQKGGAVNIGDLLFSIETGKAAFDVQAEAGGVVLEIFVKEGDEAPVKAPVCVVGKPGEEIPEITSSAAPVERGLAPAAAPRIPDAVQFTQTAAQTMSGVSPRAHALARKAGVDPALAAPTGPGGRVIERDIRALIESGGGGEAAVQTSAYEDKLLSSMRKIIAKNMMASLANSAQLTHTASFDASEIMACRINFKADPKKSGITLTDMVLYAVTRTLPAFPELNAWFMGDFMRYFGEVNLACAVDTDRGLMVPVIFGASDKLLLEISNELKMLAQSCRDGTITPNLLQGGSFTVSNLGIYGIESFTPILNPPQTGILGVNTITQRVREADGEIEIYPSMALSLTYDHRALDGAPASKFLQALCKNLEGFTVLV